MAVRIRLKRVGRRHQPSYRVVTVDGRRSQASRVIEEIGSYHPLAAQAEQQVRLNRERVEYWLSVGAQPSNIMKKLMEKQGIGSGAAAKTGA